MKNRQTIIGAHVSAAGGLENAPLAAAKLGLDCFQFFSRPPQGGRVAPITKEAAMKFKDACKSVGITEYYVHAPYVINLASGEERIRRNSIEILKTELERSAALGVAATMTHVGSAKDVGEERGVELVVEGIKEILAKHKGENLFLVEISAGAGSIIGDTFDEVAAIMGSIKDDRLLVCFDTAHAFASGYDLRDETAVNKTMDEFNRTVGLKRLYMSHCNDSQVDIGAHKDRHEHIGRGFIGEKGFRAMLASPAFRGLPLILETPHDDLLADDIALLKKLRSAAAKA